MYHTVGSPQKKNLLHRHSFHATFQYTKLALIYRSENIYILLYRAPLGVRHHFTLFNHYPLTLHWIIYIPFIFNMLQGAISLVSYSKFQHKILRQIMYTSINFAIQLCTLLHKLLLFLIQFNTGYTCITKKLNKDRRQSGAILNSFTKFSNFKTSNDSLAFRKL